MVSASGPVRPSVAAFLNDGLGPEYDLRANPAAVALAKQAAELAKPTASIRNLFLARTAAEHVAPPAAQLLHAGRGGRGGDVRFRLMISLLWVVRQDPDLSYPARAWAGLLGLPDPAGRGARRIKDALRALEELGLVRVRRSSGQETIVELRNDSGDGTRYELPGQAYTRLKKENPTEARAHRYFQVPSTLWTQGWLSVLSGPAIAMLLILHHEISLSRDARSSVWLSPSQAEGRYALSEDTRSKGLLQLEQADLVTVQRKPVSPDGFAYSRVRNLLTFKPEVLTHRPAAVRTKLTRAQLRGRDDYTDLVP